MNGAHNQPRMILARHYEQFSRLRLCSLLPSRNRSTLNFHQNRRRPYSKKIQDYMSRIRKVLTSVGYRRYGVTAEGIISAQPHIQSVEIQDQVVLLWMLPKKYGKRRSK